MSFHNRLLSNINLYHQLAEDYNGGKLSAMDFCKQLSAGLQDVSDPSYESYGVKQIRSETLTGALAALWSALSSCPPVDDELLYNPCYVESLFSVLWPVLQVTGVSTQNIEVILPRMIQVIRNMTRDDYIIVNCENPDRYYCGRAFITISKGPARLLLFDTVPPDEMNPVTIQRYMGMEDDEHAEGLDPAVKPIECGFMTKRLNGEVTKLKALPYVLSVTYTHIENTVRYQVVTDCGCNIRIEIADCTKFPHEGPKHLYINDIAYTPYTHTDRSISNTMADMVKFAHSLACREGTCKKLIV